MPLNASLYRKKSKTYPPRRKKLDDHREPPEKINKPSLGFLTQKIAQSRANLQKSSLQYFEPKRFTPLFLPHPRGPPYDGTKLLL
jgi:hypothetical protein